MTWHTNTHTFPDIIINICVDIFRCSDTLSHTYTLHTHACMYSFTRSLLLQVRAADPRHMHKEIYKLTFTQIYSIHTNIYIYICIYTYMYVCIYTYIYRYECIYIFIHMYTYVVHSKYVHIYIHIHVYSYIHSSFSLDEHIHLYIHIYIYIDIYRHM